MPAATRTYYGPFIWLAGLSLLVPIAVAMRGFRELPRPYTAPQIAPDASGVDHNLWDHLLRSYVAGGLVDYDGLKRDHLLKTYLRQLSHARPEKLESDADRLALLCNAYNALVVNGVITHRIDGSVLDYEADGKGFFDLKEHILAGETISLDHLEHEVIRPTHGEPRVHVALVCAAKSCPALRPEAYVGGQLERQLEDQATLFANDPAYVRLDSETGVLHLSKILQWYGGDFGGQSGYVDFLIRRVTDPKVAQALRGVLDGSVAVEFDAYDWALNTQAKAGTSALKKSADFGSGSIPNE